ncbi:MAG: copper-binding protein [Bryobacteraceae bacterium]|jgi:Cu/Ag efflux protein CusF
MTRRTAFLIPALLLALAACGAKLAEKRYPMEGDVMALDPASKTATIKAGKIGDWMEAMTMEYSVKPDSEFAKLKTGAHIKATVVVEDVKYYVTDIEVTQPPAGK